MLAGLSIELLVLLVAVALVSGVGITTIGPGGIFVTIALYALTPLTSAEVAGTAHTTFVATGVLGTVAYAVSGELRQREWVGTAAILSAASVVGALLGAHANTYVDRRTFGVLLGAAAAVTGLVLLYRRWRELEPRTELDAETVRGRIVLGAVGLGLGATAGLVGVGGPVFAVPVLVLLGVPILQGLAVAQVQSVFIAAFAAAGYLAHGAIVPDVALLVGIPLLVGTGLGWLIAHRVDPDRLTVVLGAVLVGVGAYLVA